LSVPHSFDKMLFSLIIVFFFSLNVISSGGHLDWWDGTEAFLVTESMALKNTAKLDPTVPSVEELRFYINYTIYTNKAIQSGNNTDPRNLILEPVYTVRSLLLSALGVPFYYLALALHFSPITSVGLFFNSLVISLTAVVIFYISTEVHRSKKTAFLLSLIFSVCSFIWPYNSTFWVQPLQALTLAVSLYLIIRVRHYDKSFLCHYTILSASRRRFFFSGLAGFFLGLSIFAHPTSLIFLPAFLTYSFLRVMRHDKKNFVSLVSVLAVMLVLIGILNYIRFGSLTEFGYGYFSTLATHDGWVGLLGLLISPGAGLLFYFPLTVLLPLGAKYMYKDNRALFFLCVYIIVANWIYVGTLSFGAEPISWSGGVAWGPRYLIPVLPFIMVILGSIIVHANKKRPLLRITVLALCIIGFYINLSAVLIWFQYGLMYGWHYEGLAAYPNSLDIITWYPQYSPIVLHTKALLTNYVSTVDPTQYANTSWYWAGYGNAPCSVDQYIYCNNGVAAVLVIGFFLVLVLILISARVGFLSYYLSRPAPFSARNLRRPKLKVNITRRLSE
jgi:hypothetical protein